MLFDGIENIEKASCGQIVAADTKRGLLVRVKDAVISIDEIQLPGGKRMKATDYLRGHSVEEGETLGGENK